ncbi:YciI family protein [Acinetobacter gerneri]|uniref:YciI family protein n=1 Tax=Acinetobacter gerneri TaxID=202952 RepID=UPI0028A68521|nr:YciI family protein [Acinetobacter gerneri]
MPFFVISCTDKEGTLEKRLAVRPRHIERLNKLDAEGRVIIAGAMPKNPENPKDGFYGSTMILDFESREALDAWLKEEPFVLEGIYEHVDVKPFNKAFPKG